MPCVIHFAQQLRKSGSEFNSDICIYSLCENDPFPPIFFLAMQNIGIGCLIAYSSELLVFDEMILDGVHYKSSLRERHYILLEFLERVSSRDR